MILISEKDLYNESTTLEHVNALAFNRSATSEGATAAVNYIEDELKKSNLNSKYQYFSWSGPTRILMRTSYLILLTYLLLARLVLVIVIYFIIKNMFEKTREMSLIIKDVSKNIYAKIPSKNETPNRPVIILSAHYDSISANISYRIQYIIFFIYRIIIAFYVIIIVILSTWLTLDLLLIFNLPRDIIVFTAYLSLIGIFISIPILYLVFFDHPSSGSIDNASGVSILIELAKIFQNDPLQNIDLVFIWPGAEEWGLKGSKKFCQAYIREFNNKYNLDKSININVDMVGTYIGLLNKVGLIRRRRLAKTANNIIEETAEKLSIPIKKYNKIIEPKSDHISFRKYARRYGKKMQTIYFHSSKDTKYIHSLKDTPDKCSLENLNGVLNICSNAIRTFDSQIE